MQVLMKLFQYIYASVIYGIIADTSSRTYNVNGILTQLMSERNWFYDTWISMRGSLYPLLVFDMDLIKIFRRTWWYIAEKLLKLFNK